MLVLVKDKTEFEYVKNYHENVIKNIIKIIIFLWNNNYSARVRVYITSYLLIHKVHYT